jgi:predicted MPP superfamily phosphohydrolase
VLFLVGFLGTALIVVGLMNWYLWRRLVRDTTRPGRGRRIGTAILVVMALQMVASVVATRVLAHSYERVLAWTGYVWLAVLFYLVVFLLALELPRLAVRRWLRRVEARRKTAVAAAAAVPAAAFAITGSVDTSPAVVDAVPPPAQPRTSYQSRRLLLGRSVAIAAGLGAAAVTGNGIRTAMGPPVANRVAIPLAKLPPRMDGLRIALVADIHLGPILGRAHCQRVVHIVNAMDPDIVAVVGDLVDGSVAELGPHAEPLRGLRSRRGSFFVTGNHEYFSGYQEWVDEINSLGVKVLRNERVEIDGLDLAGVNDMTGGQYGDGPDLDRALGGRDPARPVVLLAHQPRYAHEAARRGVDLQLSGHTHGGQLWPFHYVVRATQQPFLAGLGNVDGLPVYVTRGAGFWGPPVRVGAPPDVTLVELRAAQ